MTETVVREDRTDALEIALDRSESPPESLTNERVHQSVVETKSLPRLPMQLIEKYTEIAIRHATLKRLADGEWFAKVPGFQGVWAAERSREQTLEELKEVVLDWTLLKIEHGDRDLPVVEEIDLNVL
jgi:predicted RNase H-like HicB family nuclease